MHNIDVDAFISTPSSLKNTSASPSFSCVRSLENGENSVYYCIRSNPKGALNSQDLFKFGCVTLDASLEKTRDAL